MSLIAYVNGEFVDLNKARVSVLDRGFMYGDGLFETMRARRNRMFRLQAHMKRLVASAAELDIPLPCPIDKIEKLIYQTLEKNNLEESVVRLQLTRGESEPGLLYASSEKPTLVIVVRPFSSPPKAFYSDGVSICTAPDSATTSNFGRHRIKTTNYLPNILLKKKAREMNCFEAVALDSAGLLTEGTVSNIFLVKNKEILTPALGPYILDGITRSIVRDLCNLAGIPLKEMDLSKDFALEADEIFLTNTGISILPVSTIDGQQISKGEVGPVTRQISQAYLEIFDTEMGS